MLPQEERVFKPCASLFSLSVLPSLTPFRAVFNVVSCFDTPPSPKPFVAFFSLPKVFVRLEMLSAASLEGDRTSSSKLSTVIPMIFPPFKRIIKNGCITAFEV